MLISHPRGPRLCISILDRLNSLVDAEDSTEEYQAFSIGYQIFARIVEQGLVSQMYAAIAIDDEVITPQQTTMLKLLDSYLQHIPHDIALSNLETNQGVGNSAIAMLTYAFFSLSTFAREAMQRALGTTIPKGERHSDEAGFNSESDSSQEPQSLQELDLLLPKVCEALVLVTQCVISLTLSAEGAGAISNSPSITPLKMTLKAFLTGVTSTGGEGLVESLIETLHLLDIFVPRITFGRVVQRTNLGNIQNGEKAGETTASNGVSSSVGFSYVKRDLVRLLGILSSNNRGVQDRVRACGGIPVVMNLCVVDDQNPYMKEHAILALRNLLHENKENQAVVHEIQPVGRWDEYHNLQSIP
ncbi:uncharacterized protein FIBRA_07619 [Fibroporia radiculosa]|uniref:Ataxin-10 homolog n=1 Tax=Fibroporia radiculosa TaxID=599839 RepID=J4GF47_9APHY|nr:uncharacterized protein FIBRA_07619 [Fibroporia radiculosa]CCM05403.1 predicted protein [Fibroporia radiculosa]